MLANPTGPLAANPLLVWLAGPTPLPPCPLQVLLHHQLELPPLAQGNKVRHLVVGGVAGEPYSSCGYNVLGVQGGSSNLACPPTTPLQSYATAAAGIPLHAMAVARALPLGPLVLGVAPLPPKVTGAPPMQASGPHKLVVLWGMVPCWVVY